MLTRITLLFAALFLATAVAISAATPLHSEPGSEVKEPRFSEPEPAATEQPVAVAKGFQNSQPPNIHPEPALSPELRKLAREEIEKQKAARQKLAQQEEAQKKAEQRKLQQQKAVPLRTEQRKLQQQKAAQLRMDRRKLQQQKIEQRRAAQREAAQREAAQREAAQREAAQREAAQREAAQREAAQREAAQREAAQREAAQREAAQREAAQQKAEQQKAEQREAKRRKAEQREAEQRRTEQREARAERKKRKVSSAGRTVLPQPAGSVRKARAGRGRTSMSGGPGSRARMGSPAPRPGALALSINSIGLRNSAIKTTEEQPALDQGLIHLPQTSRPWERGDSRNVYVVGHRVGWPNTGSWKIFYRLDELKQNDELVLTAGNQTYRYKVTEKFVVTPWDVWVTDPVKGRDLLTLQTCTGPDFSQRLIIRADRV